MTTLFPPRADLADLAAVTPATPRRILLWDLPTRLFHWALVVAVCVAVVTAQIGGEWMKVHGWAGLTILGLVVFRLVWGFVGSTHSRFVSFWPAPARLRAYLRGRWQGVGHNPLGAIAIVVLLGLLMAQASTGLFSNDDIAFTGPWAGHVADELSQALTGWHRRLANVLYVLAGLHVLAIAVYTWVKKHRLVGPMITGFKTLDDQDTPHAGKSPQPARVAGWGAFAVALFAAFSVVYLASGADF